MYVLYLIIDCNCQGEKYTDRLVQQFEGIFAIKFIYFLMEEKGSISNDDDDSYTQDVLNGNSRIFFQLLKLDIIKFIVAIVINLSVDYLYAKEIICTRDKPVIYDCFSQQIPFFYVENISFQHLWSMVEYFRDICLSNN